MIYLGSSVVLAQLLGEDRHPKDSLHLASIEFLRGVGQSLKLATYDARMLSAAKRLKIPALEM